MHQAIHQALGSEVVQADPVHGGDVAQAFRVTLDDGRVVFAKTRPGASPAFFETEALGLEWLREADALAVPQVLHVDPTEPLLVLEWIGEGGRRLLDDRDFGVGLAKLHQAGAPCFGRDDRRTTGSRGLPNEPASTWEIFYATNRLLPLARMAADTDSLPASTVTMIEEIAGRLGDYGGTGEPPARLHGDLWAGNRLVDHDGRSWLIDPAAHGGHREFDLAMMQLFGGWDPVAFSAYDEASPLADGWVDRVRLHQLAPLIVHAVKFGGSYAQATTDAANLYC